MSKNLNKPVVIGQYQWQLYGKTYNVVLKRAQYQNNGRIALILDDARGMQFATLSVNFPEIEMADDEVAIKDYSEMQGCLQQLQELGVVSEVLYSVQSGFITAPVVKLLKFGE